MSKIIMSFERFKKRARERERGWGDEEEEAGGGGGGGRGPPGQQKKRDIHHEKGDR